MTGPESALVVAARDLAELLLAADTSRLEHTRGVVRAAGALTGTVPAGETDLLVATAWLHDIGYAASAVDTGFHPVDGARWLEHNGWPQRVCGLVAYHSGASYVADAVGLSRELRHFREETGAVADALTYADLTTGPRGEPTTIAGRLEDRLRRHGAESPQADSQRALYLVETANRVERRLGVRPLLRAPGAHRR